MPSRGFDRKFRNLLALYCERHAFFPDHAATREGENGDKLCPQYCQVIWESPKIGDPIRTSTPNLRKLPYVLNLRALWFSGLTVILQVSQFNTSLLPIRRTEIGSKSWLRHGATSISFYIYVYVHIYIYTHGIYIYTVYIYTHTHTYIYVCISIESSEF